MTVGIRAGARRRRNLMHAATGSPGQVAGVAMSAAFGACVRIVGFIIQTGAASACALVPGLRRVDDMKDALDGGG